MVAYAKGNKAVGYCRRCGDKVKLSKLREDGQNNLLVCRECYDIQHPAERPVRTDDAIALRKPAPDLDVAASRAITDDRALGVVLGFDQFFGER